MKSNSALSHAASRRGAVRFLQHVSLSTLSAAVLTMLPLSQAAAQTSSPEGGAEPVTEAPDNAGEAATPDPVVRCVEAYTEGQRLRNDGHLLEGRSEFWECSQAACPAALRKDCITWSDEIRAQIPTVSFRVTLDGKIAPDAKVYLDGRLLEKALDGRAVELNPGPHKVRFEYADFPAQEQDFLAAEGERYRIINAEFKSAPTPAPGPGTTASGGTYDGGATDDSIPTLTYVFAGVGAAAFINAAVWGISTSVTKSDLEATCSPSCSQSKIDAVKQRALITDISLGVGVLGVAGALVTYFTRSETPTAGSVSFDATNLGSHGAFGTFTLHTN